MYDIITCPKCNYTSGDDWSQCGEYCPMEGSPKHEAYLKEKNKIGMLLCMAGAEEEDIKRLVKKRLYEA